MRLHFHTIPLFESAPAEAELNRFLAAHRVLTVDRHLIADGPRSAWAVCVTYVDRPPPASDAQPSLAASGKPAPAREAVDYKSLLPPADFDLFARLRALRKRLAERDGVPPYAVFSNEQLAAIVRARPQSPAALARLPGIGKARLEKHGAAILAELAQAPAADLADLATLAAVPDPHADAP